MQMKFLFIRLSSLGDIVLTEPCIRLAKTHFPDAQIHYLTKPQYAPLLASFEGIDKVYLYEKKLRLIKQLRAEKYTHIIDLSAKLSSFMIRLFTPAKHKITYKKQHFLRWLIVRKLTSKSIDSVVNNYIDAMVKIPFPLRERGVSCFTHRGGMGDIFSLSPSIYPKLTPRPEDILRAKEIFTNYHIPLPDTEQISDEDGHHKWCPYILGIFPGAQHITKQYPLEKLANVILSIPEDWSISIIIFGDWDEKNIAYRLKRLTGVPLYDLTGAFDIKTLPAAISLLDLVITNDSGPMHIAAALSKPQIAIFGATHPRLGFRPLNDKAIIIQSDIKCRPCSLHGSESCSRRQLKCMYDIHSKEVFEAVVKGLGYRV